jgi:predicted transglutaminase-like cysteine proteinase
MSGSQGWRVVAHFLGGLFVLSLSTGAMAQGAPPLRLAMLNPTGMASDPPAVPAGEPFGLAVTRTSTSATSTNDYARRWRSLQPLISIEMQIFAFCRSSPEDCPSAAVKFLAVIDAGRAATGRARLGLINRAINLAIRPMSDLAHYGVPDFWASPLTTFASGAGDCEDYAIAKYVALREAGVPSDDLRLVVLHERNTPTDHAVVAARLDGRWIILDNLQMTLQADVDLRNVTPMFAFDSEDEQGLGNAASAPGGDHMQPVEAALLGEIL